MKKSEFKKLIKECIVEILHSKKNKQKILKERKDREGFDVDSRKSIESRYKVSFEFDIYPIKTKDVYKPRIFLISITDGTYIYVEDYSKKALEDIKKHGFEHFAIEVNFTKDSDVVEDDFHGTTDYYELLYADKVNFIGSVDHIPNNIKAAVESFFLEVPYDLPPREEDYDIPDNDDYYS